MAIDTRICEINWEIDGFGFGYQQKTVKSVRIHGVQTYLSIIVGRQGLDWVLALAVACLQAFSQVRA